MFFPHFLSLHVVMNMHGTSLDCVTLHCTYSYHPRLIATDVYVLSSLAAVFIYI